MTTGRKTYLEIDVLEAARERLRWVFDRFPRVLVSFSGGKDSTVLTHLALEVAAEQGRLPLDVMFIDWEAQYQATIEHVTAVMTRPDVKPWWICLPMGTENGSSHRDPWWVAWDRDRRDLWVRDYPDAPGVIKDYDALPFYRYGQTFEDFVPQFQAWLADGQPLACLIGLRADESLRRFKAVAKGEKDKKSAFEGRRWTSEQGKGVVNATPIYDWRVEDIWAYVGKTGCDYNRIYDRMYLSGMKLHDMRICEPFSYEARRNLKQYHHLEPHTWAKLVQRVEGAGAGYHQGGSELYALKTMTRPPGFPTWKAYALYLLGTLPPAVREHYERRVGVFVGWFQKNLGWEDLKDFTDPRLESARLGGSWRMVCRTILKGDYFCAGLCFGVNRNELDKFEALKDKYKDL